LTDLIGELSAGSDVFYTWRPAHNVRLYRSGIKNLDHPVVGDLTFAYESMDHRPRGCGLTRSPPNSIPIRRRIEPARELDRHAPRAPRRRPGGLIDQPIFARGFWRYLEARYCHTGARPFEMRSAATAYLAFDWCKQLSV
jgi:hypothetical protein